MTLALGLGVLASAAGCRGPRSHADDLALEKNPLRDARAGELCRYRATRGGAGVPVPEEWTIRVTAVSGGSARVEVSVLGPPRVPPAPAPREPGYGLFMAMKDEGFTGAALLRLFHRPDLTARGIRRILERDVREVSGTVRDRPVLFSGKTCQARELTLVIEDPSVVRAVYRVVLLDEVPVVGILEAELEQVFRVVDPDGEVHEETRVDRIELVDFRN